MSPKISPAFSLRTLSCCSTARWAQVNALISAEEAEARVIDYWKLAEICEGGYQEQGAEHMGPERSEGGFNVNPWQMLGSWLQGHLISSQQSSQDFQRTISYLLGFFTGQAMLGHSILHKSLTQVLSILLNHTAIQYQCFLRGDLL